MIAPAAEKPTYPLRKLVPFATPFVFGACCYLAAAVPYLLSGALAALAVAATFVIAVLSAGGLAVFAAEQEEARVRTASLVVTPSLLVAGSFLFLLMVDSSAMRFVTVTGGMLLLSAYYAKLDAADETSFIHLSRSMRAVALFCLLAFSFGIGRFVHVPLPFMVALAAAGLGLAAHQDLRGAVEGRTAVLYAGALGLLGGELYLGIAFLPTPYMTNAAVLLIVMELISTATRGLFRSDEHRLVPRGHMIASCALLVTLLVTSPWS